MVYNVWIVFDISVASGTMMLAQFIHYTNHVLHTAPSIVQYLEIDCDSMDNIPAKFMEPTWGPPGSCRSQMGPMLAP